MTTATTPAGSEVEVVVTAESGTARLQTGQLRYGGVVVGHWSQAGSLPRMAEALVAADEAISKLGVRQSPTSIRFDAYDLSALARIAEAEDRSVGYIVRRAVRAEIERAERAQRAE